jgi:hypothetical protein
VFQFLILVSAEDATNNLLHESLDTTGSGWLGSLEQLSFLTQSKTCVDLKTHWTNREELQLIPNGNQNTFL